MLGSLSLTDIGQLITGQAGVVLILLVILWTGYKRYWIWGREYRDLETRSTEIKEEAEWWRDRYLSAMIQATKATDLAQKTVEHLSPGG